MEKGWAAPPCRAIFPHGHPGRGGGRCENRPNVLKCFPAPPPGPGSRAPPAGAFPSHSVTRIPGGGQWRARARALAQLGQLRSQRPFSRNKVSFGAPRPPPGSRRGRSLGVRRRGGEAVEKVRKRAGKVSIPRGKVGVRVLGRPNSRAERKRIGSAAGLPARRRRRPRHPEEGGRVRSFLGTLLPPRTGRESLFKGRGNPCKTLRKPPKVF